MCAPPPPRAPPPLIPVVVVLGEILGQRFDFGRHCRANQTRARLHDDCKRAPQLCNQRRRSHWEMDAPRIPPRAIDSKVRH